MEQGAILVLDELDLAHPANIMCLQSVLERNPYYVKATGENIEPKEGFMVVATANTKMAGDETGKYIGTQILNEAFRDRFAAFFEVNYPSKELEIDILTKHSKNVNAGISAKEIDWLVSFANETREKQKDESEGVLSLRRMIDFVSAYVAFKDFDKTMDVILNRFTGSTKEALLEYIRLIQSKDSTVADNAEDEDDDVIIREVEITSS